MDARSVRRLRTLTAGIAAAAVVATIGIGGPGWAATAAPDSGAPHVSPHSGPANLKISPELLKGLQGRHAVFVQLSGAGAADTASKASSTTAGKTAAKDRRAAIKKTASSAFSTAKGKDASAKELFTITNSVPGFAAQVDSTALVALAARSDVVKITPLVSKQLENANTAQLTGAVKNWQANNLGKGVTVGVIDTGIDYTHADFGGVGTVAAWDTAHANSADPYWRNTLPALASAKIVGGWDFVGDDYNADPTAPDYQPVPHPDNNPLDCNEHGTHVSGTVGGYGVAANGTTFTGNYATLTSDDLFAMKVGPGMAPGVSLYGLKVFGCTGSTDAVIPALDWALDPNGDGDFSDHLDIINMSLGSDYAPADDPENAIVDKLAEHGVLPVIAMGNAGDITSVGGAPGNATRSVAVASSVDSYILRDGLRVNAPAGEAGIALVQFSVLYDWNDSTPVTGDVAAIPGSNADGCSPLSAADAAKVAGKVAWLEWDDNDSTRRCGSVGRSANVAAAGAIGSVFTSSLEVFGAGISGSAVIPVVQLTGSETARLRPAVDAGTLNVTFDGSLATSQPSIIPGISDTLSSFSSRGTHGSIGVVKPDIAAPGDSIASAWMGSGNKPLVISGTSMATPNVAGIAALVKLAHPTWTTEQLKADLMNTAGHDVYAGENQTGTIYGPNRVGAGRVDAAAAVTNDLLVYSKDVKGAVSASFGVVTVPITSKLSKYYTDNRTLVVQNTSKKTRVVSLSYDAITAQPGVSYTVWPSKLVVLPGRSAYATVILKVDPTKLRKTIDPTQEATQIGVARQYVSDSSGRVLVSEKGKQALRVPVYGAVKPTSDTKTTAVIKGKGSSATTSLDVTGRGFAQGSGPEAFTSLLSVTQLGATSGKLKPCVAGQVDGCTNIGSDSSGDLRYVGAGSSKTATGYADGWLYFGINTWGQWASYGTTVIPFVDIDVNGDGAPDYEVYVQPYTGTDVLLATLVDLNTGAALDLEPVNFNFGDVDTNVFDNDTMMIPVWPAAIGVTDDATSFPITYQVGTFSGYTGGTIDSTSPIAYDVVDPALVVSEPLYLDNGGTKIPYQLGSDANKDTKALVLHLQGATGKRAEVISVTSPKHNAAPWGKKHWSSAWHSLKWHWNAKDASGK